MGVRTSVWVSAVLAFGLHVSAWVALARSGTPPVTVSVASRNAAPAVSVRRIAAGPAAKPATARPAAPAPRRLPRPQPLAAGVASAEAVRPPPAPSPQEPAHASPDVGVDPAPPDPAPAADGFPPEPSERDEAVYLPRQALTASPTAQTPVLLVFPETGTHLRHVVGVVSLFIDETGAVQRIRIEAPGLPESFETAVRSAFAPVRFTPGEVNGQPVRALMRVEVRFDIDELPQE